MSAIAQIVESRKRDLGGFEVRRILLEHQAPFDLRKEDH